MITSPGESSGSRAPATPVKTTCSAPSASSTAVMWAAFTLPTPQVASSSSRPAARPRVTVTPWRCTPTGAVSSAASRSVSISMAPMTASMGCLQGGNEDCGRLEPAATIAVLHRPGSRRERHANPLSYFVLEDLAGFERRVVACRNFDALGRAGPHAGARLPVAYLEGAETGKLYFFAAFQIFGDGVKNTVDSVLCCLTAQVVFFRTAVDAIGLGSQGVP